MLKTIGDAFIVLAFIAALVVLMLAFSGAPGSSCDPSATLPWLRC